MSKKMTLQEVIQYGKDNWWKVEAKITKEHTALIKFMLQGPDKFSAFVTMEGCIFLSDPSDFITLCAHANDHKIEYSYSLPGSTIMVAGG